MGRQLLAVLSDRRGASEVVGLVLLFGLVLVGATLIFAAGSSTLNSAESQIQLETAEQSVETLNTELKSVSSKRENATTDLQLRSTERNNVYVRNDTSIFITAIYDNERNESIMVDDIGSIVYTHEDGTKIVSEAGAVWRVGKTGTTTVTAPPLEYRNGTLLFDIIRTHGPIDPVDGMVRARRDGLASREMTDGVYRELIKGSGEDQQVRLPDRLEINVTGTNQDAWKQYFDDEFGDDPRVSFDSGDPTFELISSVEAGTPTDTTAYSLTEFAGQPSKHVFEYTVETELQGSLAEIEIDYEGNPDLSTLAAQDPQTAIQSIGVDTTGDGFLDSTAGVDAVKELDVTGSTVTIELETGDGQSTLPVTQGDTIMLRYGTLEEGSVTNPDDPSADGLDLTLTDANDNTESVSDASLDLTPEIDPVSVDNGELVIRGKNISVQNINTAFEDSETEEGERIPVDVVIVSDQSGSMNDNDPNQLRPAATDAFIDKLAESAPADRVATVHFSARCFEDDHDSKVIEPLQAASQVDAQSQDREERADCNTNYHAGLRTALNVLEDRPEDEKQNRSEAIVFMGDGVHNADEVEYDSPAEYEFDEFPNEQNILELADEADEQNTTIHTIGFSEGVDDDARQLLDETADRTGGTTQFPEAASDLEETFEDVADDVTEPSFFINHEPVSVTARFNGNEYTFDGDGTTFQPGTGSPSTNRPLFDPTAELPRQNAPGGEVPSAQEIRNGRAVRLALTVNEHGCDEDGTFEGPFGSETIGENKYSRQICEPVDVSEPVRTIEPGDSTYFVLTSGDTLDDDIEANEWQESLDSRVEDAGLVSDGELDLSERQALIVTRVGPDSDAASGSYGAYLVETTPVELTYDEVAQPGSGRLFGISVQEVELDS